MYPIIPEPEPVYVPEYAECVIQTDYTVPMRVVPRANDILKREPSDGKLINDRQAEILQDSDDNLSSQRSRRKPKTRGKALRN